jgi:predicted RNA-binding Zn ribbon-like protein
MLPGEPVPVRLMNTIWADASGVHDDLHSPAGVDAWLDAVGIARSGARATTAELARARVLRDAARRLAAFVTGDSRQAASSAMGSVRDAVAAVNVAVSQLPAPQLELRGGRLEPAAQARPSPVAAGIAQVAGSAIELLSGSAAASLRACNAPGCVLYFAKTHPRREWCSLACGNRARAARHYEKLRSARAGRREAVKPTGRVG